MSELVSLVKDRVEAVLNTDDAGLTKFIQADQSVLHDPFLYSNMESLVDQLHQYAKYQQTHPNSILVIDTDYDTDGIMSAAVLVAALNVFAIHYRVYVPTMDNGYGLSPKAVSEMNDKFAQHGQQIDLILTADNGTNAIEGVKAAKQQGIKVLVTDHHLGSDQYADADVIVNPNQTLPDGNLDAYPFKGNAGAAVAYKTMLAYATKYANDKVPLIEALIVFAGIADVSDVMPIVDENHYMVKCSVNELKRLTELRKSYVNPKLTFEQQLNQVQTTIYPMIKHTPYPMYNAVFYGLFDLMMFLQHSKDVKRFAQNKNAIPLVDNEELISWYLSPMLNAPRRVHSTAKEAMMGVIDPRSAVRYHAIDELITMNAQKSTLRDGILSALDWNALSQHVGNVIVVNTRPGIAGLIAGQITERLQCATLVLAVQRPSKTKIYDEHAFDGQFNAADLVIGGSARSTALLPLNVIMAKIAELRPDLIVGGGGHAQAAGYSIRYTGLHDFKLLFDQIAQQVGQTMLQQLKDQPQTTDQFVNELYLGVDVEPVDGAIGYDIDEHAKTLVDDLTDLYVFEESLRPFGKDFTGDTKLKLRLNQAQLKRPKTYLNLDFWQTLKFNWHGVDVLTFNVELADQIKAWLKQPNADDLIVSAKLNLNEFNGRVTPQLIMEKINN